MNRSAISPVQHAAVATDDASSAMLAFVAVYVDGLIACKHELRYCVSH